MRALRLVPAPFIAELPDVEETHTERQETTIKNTTFLGQKPIYSGSKGVFSINYTKKFNSKGLSRFLALTGNSWTDKKYNIFLNVMGLYEVLVTDSDLLGHDQYIDKMNKDQFIVIYFSNLCSSPSKKRLQIAAQKLLTHGFKVKLLNNKEEAEAYTTMILNNLNQSKGELK